jgi:hypothetical protein
MDKTCFVIMPISDPENYSDGHFKRVYEYIIKPSCINAGFDPIRADDILNTNYIALDVIKRIINCDMAICDLSSRNPNVFYELGIRQSFNLPVTLIRDSLTERVFDIQGFRDIEYDENLRIDSVENSISIISETLINTFNTRGQEINSLISLLGIHPAKISNSVEISKDTELILNYLFTLGTRLTQIEKSFPMQRNQSINIAIDEKGSVWKDLTNAEKNNILVGDIVDHSKFGKGKVVDRSGLPQNPIATVWFEYAGEKKLMLNYVGSLKKLVPQE